eukprot:scaffold1712_cov261-Pinguiococcus_pyrenoidosus.AAC.17
MRVTLGPEALGNSGCTHTLEGGLAALRRFFKALKLRREVAAATGTAARRCYSARRGLRGLRTR